MARLARVALPAGARYARLRDDGAAEILSGAAWLGGRPTGEVVAPADLRLLAPCEPTKIVCVGKNYAEHAKEMGGEVPAEPLIFIKPASSVIGPGANIVRPRTSTEVHHEAELGVVVARRLRNVSAAEARAGTAGLVCVNDVTARDIQRREKHFTHAKGFDSFCPIGPWIEDGALDASNLAIRCRVNGQMRQDGRTSDMVVGTWDLLAFVSSIMTLEPGDVLSTGTPAGVGALSAGDVVEIEVEGIGVLRSPVVDEAA